MDRLTRGALGLAGAGYSVLPVGAKKTPSITGGIHAATRNRATILEWSEAGLLKNVGVRTGSEAELVVVDADTRAKAEGLEAEHGPPHVRTKRGGHWYFRHPKDGRISSKELEGGVDIKADGGYVLAPPSKDKTWTGAIPDPAELPVLPDSLRPKGRAELPKRPRLPEDKLEKAVQAVYKHYPEEGLRYEFGRHLSGYLLRNGIAPEDAYAIQYEALSLTDEGADKAAEKNIGGVVTSTAKRLAEGEPVTGGPNVEEYAPGLTGDLAGIFGWGPRTYELTEAGNAERFADSVGKDFRYVWENKGWVRWTGARWEECPAEVVARAMVEVVRKIHEEAARAPTQDRQRELSGFARSSQNTNRAKAAVEQARALLGVHVTDFDKDPDLLNVLNGTIDLTTGELRPHKREDLITKLAPVEYDPDAEAPLFEKFLRDIFSGDEELISYVQRFAGYSLTGSVEERALALLHGRGKNGKSTLVELFHDMLGDYAASTDAETILQNNLSTTAASYYIAELAGARFVSTSETDEGRRLAEGRVKKLTGNETITGRKIYGAPFDFFPQFTLWYSTNSLPEVKGTDEAIWDRLKRIPFLARFEGKAADTKLPKKLREELPGVLAWAVRGSVEWAEHGLGSAKAVDAATLGYRADMDVLSQFISERCELGTSKTASSEVLYEAWKAWADAAGEDPGTKNWFGRRLTDRGFERHNIDNRTRGWRGIALAASENVSRPVNVSHSKASAKTQKNQGLRHNPEKIQKSLRKTPREEKFGKNAENVSHGEIVSHEWEIDGVKWTYGPEDE